MRKLLENPVLPVALLAALLLSAFFGLDRLPPGRAAGFVLQTAEIPVPQGFSGFEGF